MIEYNRISFPNRAEDLRYNTRYKHSYHIYLDHWDDFLEFLNESIQKVITRDATHALTIYGPQGAGKTLFTDKLKSDYYKVKSDISLGKLEHSPENVWQKLILGKLSDVTNLTQVTQKCEFIDITDDPNWLDNLNKYKEDTIKIVVADNAERAYFGASLAGMKEYDFLANKDGVGDHVAQQFVKLARTDLRKTLFIILGNDSKYLSSFHAECERQHANMAKYYELDLPTPIEKESIIRKNINRLNTSSYWKYIDSVDNDKRISLYNELTTPENTIPMGFEAIDDAFSKSTKRPGRPANKCLLSFVLATEGLDQANEIASSLAGRFIDTPDYEFTGVVKIYNIPDTFASKIMGNESDECKMLESEFSFRFIIFNNNWMSRLLSGDEETQVNAINTLNSMLNEPSIGATTSTKDAFKVERDSLCEDLLNSVGIVSQDLSSFWDSGAIRGSRYENILRKHVVGYNTTGNSGSKKRPDIVLREYVECSILNADEPTQKKISEAIARTYHAVEITTMKGATSKKVTDYLKNKIPNYIELLKVK